MFSIRGVDPAPFARYFAMSAAELAGEGARRVIADGPGYPCRVSLVDAAPGEELVLCHHVHQEVGAWRAAGPIYVRRDARRARFDEVVPPVLATRLLSVRGYTAEGELREAEVAPGTELTAHIARLFADDRIAHLDVHNARPGCFAARVDRR